MLNVFHDVQSTQHEFACGTVVTNLPFKNQKEIWQWAILAAKELHSLVKVSGRKPLQKESSIPLC